MLKLYAGVSALLILGALAAVDASTAGRVYNGQAASKGQFPYQAFLKITRASGSVMCGGSVISNRWVISAAHCFKVVDSTEITLGVVDRLDTTGFKTKSEEVHTHPEFLRAGGGHDIALIKTTDQITFSDVIGAIKLPSGAGADPTVYDDTTGVISGWGLSRPDRRGSERNLQYANTHIMNHNACSAFYPNLLDSMVCSDNETYASGTCKGDSGGPLASTGGDRYLIGIVSYAQHTSGEVVHCGKNPQPKIYTNVASYLDWIAETTGTTVPSPAPSTE